MLAQYPLSMHETNPTGPNILVCAENFIQLPGTVLDNDTFFRQFAYPVLSFGVECFKLIRMSTGRKRWLLF